MPDTELFKPFRSFSQLMFRASEVRCDFAIPFCMLVLSVIGVFFIFSAQSYVEGTQWVKQIFWIAIGSVVYLAVSSINYKIYLQTGHLIYAACVLLLIPLAIEAFIGINLPLVETRYNSTRWLDFGVLSLQPSETAKIGALIMIASLLSRSEVGDIRDSMETLLKVGAIFVVPFILIFLQPDLGSCLVFIPMVFTMLFVSKLSFRFFSIAAALFLLMTAIVAFDLYSYHAFLEENELSAMQSQKENAYGSEHSVLPLHDYQRNRILGFILPDLVDPQGIGVSWNRNQSLIAAGSGGLTGKGHNMGTQAKLGYLPPSVATNDFIFSVLLEETGFIGGLTVITLYAVILLNTLRIAGLAKDRFGMLLCMGVSAIIIMHMFINTGMTLGIMPITGLPLPFVSYGGSFIIVCCILLGIVQSVYRFRKDFS